MPIAAEFEVCYAAVASRDRRFDGQFYTGVLTTGIYCRPSCPARTPLRHNVRFFPSPAAAQDAGLRACRRCRPELAPDLWRDEPAAELAGRALRLIDAGLADDGVHALASRLHLSQRHLRRVLTTTYGAGPSALITIRRVRLARMLVDQTDLPVTRVAFAAGFGSVRQFNQAFKDAFHTTPSDVRRGRGQPPAGGGILSLSVRHPFDGAWVLQWAGLHALPGHDRLDGDTWQRHTDAGVVWMRPGAATVEVGLELDDPDADIRPAVAMARRAFDVDADIGAVQQHLAADPLLGPLLRERPGLRIPGSPDPWEGAVRTLLGQQVSAAAANTLTQRLADLHEGPGLPPPEALTDLPLEATIGLTRQRATALRGLAVACTDWLDLSPAADPSRTLEALRSIPGVGPWTASTISLLVLCQPDAWPAGDLALRKAVTDLTGTPTSAARLDELATRWRPWRGYAAMYLWHHYLNRMTR